MNQRDLDDAQGILRVARAIEQAVLGHLSQMVPAPQMRPQRKTRLLSPTLLRIARATPC